MDSAIRKDFYRALLRDYIEHPRTIILSSHLLGELEEILENVLLLDEGTVQLHLPILRLKEYAIGFRGNEQAILQVIDAQDMIYKEEFGKGSLFVIVKTERLHEDYEKIRKHGIEFVSISIDDLCNHLTAKRKGGIDDVFKRG